MIKYRVIIAALYCFIVAGNPCFSQAASLEFFISQGLIHSPVLMEMSNQVGSNAIDSVLVRAGHKPQVSYNGLLYYAPVINGIGYSEAITNLSNISSLVYVTQRIFNQKTLENQYSKYGIRNQTLRITSKLTENELRKSITLQYLAACQVSDDIRINRELLASLKDEEALLRQLVEKGLYKQVDYLSFMVQFRSQELLLSNFEMQYQKEVTALHILCGIPDTLEKQLELPQIALISRINANSSPFFTRFAIDSLKIENEKLGIDQNYKPSFNWFSDAGLLGNVPKEIYKNFGFSFGLSLSVPIFDGNQRKLNYEKLKIAENTRMNYAVYFKQQFNQELQRLYSELKQTREIIPVAEQQLAFAESVLTQDRYLLNYGNISITDYVIALNSYISVKRNMNQYQIKILEIIAEINYLNQ
jgi:outer membrane protein TolC